MDMHDMLLNEIHENENLRAQRNKARVALLALLHRDGGPTWLEAVKLLKPDLERILTELSR